jgi:hypothetical protein
MTTNDYVNLKAMLGLAMAAFNPEFARRTYERISIYKETDLRQVYEDIKYIGQVWNDLTNYLRTPVPQRAELYRQLCDQPRIAQALVTLRRKNNPPVPI